MAVDLTQTQAAGSTTIVGSAADGTEGTAVASTTDGELKIVDVANAGGVETVLTIAAGVTVELKVGASRKANRKYVIFIAGSAGVKWGFSSTAPGFDALKAQFFILPFGDGTAVYLKNTSGASVTVQIGEA